jgi:capsule polysaccharide export protein KpsE/RkpR
MTQLDRIETAIRRMAVTMRSLRLTQRALFTVVLTQGEEHMATFEEVTASLAGLQAGVDTLTEAVTAEAVQVGALFTEIEALKKQIADGTAATPEQLDGLLATAQAIQNNLQSATTNVAALVPDPPTV